jgi:hypothetical protein
MTLLELVIAMSVMALLMTGLAATIGSGLTLVRNNRNRDVAANLASQEMDLVRQTATASFTSVVPAVTTQVVGGVPYTVNRELTWVGSNATSGPCDAPNQTPQVLRVHIWVDWPNRAGAEPATADSVLTPPVGAYSATSGHIAVSVLDSDANPLYDVGVTITGPTAESSPTNSSGCAFFAFIPAGTYTVALNTVGYVDRQGNANPSQTVGVSVGQVSSVQFDYDKASTIQATFGAANGGVVPTDLPITIANTILLPTGTKTYTGTGTTRSIANLFPSNDGFEMWAGQCADADPEGTNSVGAAFYPGATRDPPVELDPAQTTNATVSLTPLQVLVTNQTGTPEAGRSVTLVHAADSVCASGETHTVGTTDASGNLSLSLPFGTWQIKEQGHSVSGSWPTVTLSPLDTLPRATVTVAGVG